MRMAELLREAADLLDKGESPLETPFLAEHDVTIYEAYDMAEFMAMGARVVAWVLENPKDASAVLQGGMNTLGMRKITETLAKMNAASRGGS